MAIDPVCQMVVDEKTAEHKTVYNGETFYFCAPGCKIAFEENPLKYLEGEKEPMEDMPKKKWWQIWK